MDLLAVERRDERRLQPVADVMADLVTAVLGVADLAGATLQDVVRAQHGLEQARPAEHVRGVLDEHVVEALVARDEPQPQ